MNTQSATTTTVETESYNFTPQEFARLNTYRAAVAAGFYTDRLPNQSRNSRQEADVTRLLLSAA
jgi:hypothetical protein